MYAHTHTQTYACTQAHIHREREAQFHFQRLPTYWDSYFFKYPRTSECYIMLDVPYLAKVAPRDCDSVWSSGEMQPGSDVDGAARATRLHAWLIRRIVTLWGKANTMVNRTNKSGEIPFMQLYTIKYLQVQWTGMHYVLSIKERVCVHRHKINTGNHLLVHDRRTGWPSQQY